MVIIQVIYFEILWFFQASALRAWGGKPENVKAGQEELLKRAKVSYCFIPAFIDCTFEIQVCLKFENSRSCCKWILDVIWILNDLLTLKYEHLFVNLSLSVFVILISILLEMEIGSIS